MEDAKFARQMLSGGAVVSTPQAQDVAVIFAAVIRASGLCHSQASRHVVQVAIAGGLPGQIHPGEVVH